jgi:translocation and assembly module TamB
VAPDATRISDLALLVDGGRLLVSGQVGGTLDLSLQAARVPLSAADIVVPGLGLSGSLDGRLMLQGTTALPTGSYEITLSQLASQPLRDAGLRAVNVRAAGQLADARASVQATIDATQAGQLRIVGSVPLGTDGILDLTVGGRLDLRAMNGALSASGQRIAGTSDVDLRVRGTGLAPVAEGSMTLSGGTFEDPIQGVRLTAIEGRLVAKGTMVQLERLTAQTPPGGSLAATGRITLDPAAGLPADIHITGTRAQLATNATTTAVADLNLSLRGPLLRQPQLGGRIDLVSLDVTVPDRLPVTLRPLPATKHVQPPAAAAARLAVARQRQASSRRAKFIGADLDLTITAQNRIFVRGRGIEAELGGDLRLTGTSGAPIAVGGFEMRRGQLDILGQRLSFSRGRLDFRGDLMPSLDFMAETRAGSVTARIGVTGPAASPEFLITSNPDLPQDEVLSRILFQRAAGGLTPGQAIQLAQAVATLSGGSGSGAFEQVRRSLGVDSLDISTNSSGDPTVGASRYISDRVRLGVRAGARPDESAVSLDVDITRRLKAQGQVGADGRSSVGVGVEWEY